MISREAAHILAKAHSTLVLLAAAETQERVKRLQDRPAPLTIYKIKHDRSLRARD